MDLCREGLLEKIQALLSLPSELFLEVSSFPHQALIQALRNVTITNNYGISLPLGLLEALRKHLEVSPNQIFTTEELSSLFGMLTSMMTHLGMHLNYFINFAFSKLQEVITVNWDVPSSGIVDTASSLLNFLNEALKSATNEEKEQLNKKCHYFIDLFGKTGVLLHLVQNAKSNFENLLNEPSLPFPALPRHPITMLVKNSAKIFIQRRSCQTCLINYFHLISQSRYPMESILRTSITSLLSTMNIEPSANFNESQLQLLRTEIVLKFYGVISLATPSKIEKVIN